jgi:hypothetical protein
MKMRRHDVAKSVPAAPCATDRQPHPRFADYGKRGVAAPAARGGGLVSKFTPPFAGMRTRFSRSFSAHINEI